MSKSVSLVRETEIQVVAVGPVWLNSGGSSGEIFIVDVTPTSSGLVANKTFVGGVELDTCLSDTSYVRVHFGCEGGADKYTPSVTVNDIQATVVESGTKRWFTGYADLVLANGVTTVTALSDAGGTDTASIEVLGPGPSVLSVIIGNYPGSQTELKQGDLLQVTVTTELDATAVLIDGYSVPVSAGIATTTLTIGSGSGLQAVTAQARNSFGTYGVPFLSAPLTLNQTYPTFGTLSVTYPVGLGAFNAGDGGQVSCQVFNADTVSYTSTAVLIDTPNTYAASKPVWTTALGYINGVNNYTITATRAANGATATKLGQLKVVTQEATAYITTTPAGRMLTSPTGVSYSVRIYPNQVLASAPSLFATKGTWTGSWVLSGGYWSRTLVVADSVDRGAGYFSGLVVTGLTNLSGSTITSGDTYMVGGFSNRTLTFPAFSRVAPIGTSVVDVTKLSAAISGVALTRYTDNAVRTSGFYPANADGTYNATGAYMGLSDSTFAGSNTTGTLQATIQESA